MRGQGQIEEADYLAALRLHLRSLPSMAALAAVLVALVCWALIVGQYLVFAAAAVFPAIYFLWSLPRHARRNFRDYKALSKPVSMDVRDDGLFFERENGSGLVPWSHILKWRSNEALVLIYPSRNLFYIVPSRFFDSPEAFGAFRETLARRTGNGG